jgi:hypothetical protein
MIAWSIRMLKRRDSRTSKKDEDTRTKTNEIGPLKNNVCEIESKPEKTGKKQNTRRAIESHLGLHVLSYTVVITSLGFRV